MISMPRTLSSSKAERSILSATNRRIAGGNLAEKAGVLARLLVLAQAALGCAGDHHVSPWGAEPSRVLEAYMRPPDLGAQLALMDAETKTLGLVKTSETEFALGPKQGGQKGMLRAYEGRDVGGRPVHAVRVATGHGIVLALGPLEAGDLDRSLATELVPALLGSSDGNAGSSGVAFSSGTDLNGDGSPDVVVRNEAGALAIWRVGELGSGAYEITMVTPATSAIDVDQDGRIDLFGQVPLDPRDPIAPRLTDVATFDGAGYSDSTPSARAWHAHEAETRPARKGDADAVRLRSAIERAWHGILAGTPRETVLADLEREKAPASLATSLEMHRRRIVSLPRR
jgi:hypothetical protein